MNASIAKYVSQRTELRIPLIETSGFTAIQLRSSVLVSVLVAVPRYLR